MYRMQLRIKETCIYVVSVHAAETYMVGIDKIQSCITSMLDEVSVSTFTAISFTGEGEKLKCTSGGNCKMRLILDVRIQILVN